MAGTAALELLGELAGEQSLLPIPCKTLCGGVNVEAPPLSMKAQEILLRGARGAQSSFAFN